MDTISSFDNVSLRSCCCHSGKHTDNLLVQSEGRHRCCSLSRKLYARLAAPDAATECAKRAALEEVVGKLFSRLVVRDICIGILAVGVRAFVMLTLDSQNRCCAARVLSRRWRNVGVSTGDREARA
jgi:hypothetical protein